MNSSFPDACPIIWRVAAIRFLNTAPLLWGLDREPRLRLFSTVPSACADALAAGEADIGIIPVIEMARIPQLWALPGLAIAARQEVRSILLITRSAPERIRRLALDSSSRTSAALAQILLRRRFGAEFAVVTAAPDWRAMLADADAGLLIGDPALRLRLSGEAEKAGLQVYDLASVWHQWTGLPFVFALWAVRTAALPQPDGENARWLTERFSCARQEGFAHLDAIATEWAQRLQLPEQEIRRYLEHNLEHRLSSEHLDGLRHFFELAAAEGLIGEPAMPRFLPIATTA